MALINLFRQAWFYAGNLRWKLIIAVLLHALSTITFMANPYIFSQILNVFQLYNDRLMERVIYWFWWWLATWFWFNICHRVGRYFEISTAYRVKQNFINEHYKIVTQLPLSWHQDHHSGDTINRINVAAKALEDFTGKLFIYVHQIFMMIGPLAALAMYSWEVALLGIFLAALTMLIINRFDRILVVLYRQVNNYGHKVASTVFDYINNIKTIITLRLGLRTAEELDKKIESGYVAYVKAGAIVDSTKWFFVSLGRLFTEAGIVFYYIWRELNLGQTILIGNISAVFQYTRQVSDTFMNIAYEYQQALMMWTNFEESLPIQKAARYIEMETSATSINNLEISKLNFGYSNEKAVLEDLDIILNKGEKVAIIGESGSGKSTLLALLRGLYVTKKVKLKINDEKADGLESLFPITTLVPQEPEIFDQTIKYNVTMGLHYKPKEITDALSIASLDKVIAKLPNGIDTSVREKGVSLSGGERQRLALARAVLAAKDSQIILMDEPTSSVDSRNEVAIYRNMFKHFGDRIIVSTIHRLNLLEMFDRVIVMDSGKIVQQGSFKELKSSKGAFSKLWESYKENSEENM